MYISRILLLKLINKVCIISSVLPVFNSPAYGNLYHPEYFPDSYENYEDEAIGIDKFDLYGNV